MLARHRWRLVAGSLLFAREQWGISMQISPRLLVLSLLLLLLTMSCAGFPFWQRHSPSEVADDSTPAQVKTELGEPRFDGYELTGRFMIGVLEGSIRLDKRLVEEVSINLESVKDCASEQSVSVLIADRFPPPATQDDLLILEQGYWYGADVYFPLFIERPGTQPGPECIEVSFLLRSFEGKVLAHTRAQVHREPRTSPEPDGGTELP